MSLLNSIKNKVQILIFIEAVKKMIMALPTDRKVRLLKYIQKQPAPAAA